MSRQQELEAGEKIRQTKLEIRATRDQNMRTKGKDISRIKMYFVKQERNNCDD